MTLDMMKTALSMAQLPSVFDELYPKIAHTWQTYTDTILSDEYITQTLDACYALIPYRAQILRDARQVRKEPALRLLVCLLEQWARKGGNLNDRSYTPPEGIDFLHLFPAIPTMPETVAYLRQRNVPESVIIATMQEYDASVEMRLLATGRPCFTVDRLNWLQRLIHNRYLHIGRFNFDLPTKFPLGVRVYEDGNGALAVLADNLQVHSSGQLLGSAGCTDSADSFLAQIRETDEAFFGHPCINGIVQRQTVTLPKDCWHLRLCANDMLVNIHIPRAGDFHQQTISRSFQQAKEVFATCYPDEPFAAFRCCSWLLSEDLHNILKPDSNILAFQSFFTKTPTQSSGEGIFPFVFPGCPTDNASFSALPEDTGLQRAVKQCYLDGGCIHDGAGFFF